MIETPTRNNLADFKQRYSGVMGWYMDKDSQAKTLVRVHSVGTDRVTFRDSVGNTFYALVDGGIAFEFLPVEKAWRNTKDNTYYIHRVPARQWRRGICEENTTIHSLPAMLGQDYEQIGWYERIFAVYSTPQDYSKEVTRFLADKRPHVAISPHFAVNKDSLFFNNIKVGKYVAKNTEFQLSDSGVMIEQEVRDCITRNKYPFTVRSVS